MKVVKALKAVKWQELRTKIAFCPLCDRRKVMIKLDADEMAVRCLSCEASAACMSTVSVLRKVSSDIGSLDVYELSARGSLFNYLKKHAKTLTCSEYFPDLASGEFRNGVQCQDVQQLSFPDASFDMCTSTEVFEHVPDDSKGFSEILRVLRPNGVFLFTVPLHDSSTTVERALIASNGEVQHLLPPAYHNDPIRPASRILVFRDYGWDVTERLREAGFAKAEILKPQNPIPWGYARPVVVAYR